ncbi:MAG: hypothetical protein PF495_06825, partial [Spirochaetales bacterium]|nr:hypothetical protein [Spirochaetales bacterium]
KDELRKKFYAVFEDKFEKKHLARQIEPGELDRYFELCYKELDKSPLRERMMEAWLRRNKKVRDLTDFLKESSISDITLTAEGGQKITLVDGLAQQAGMMILSYYRDNIAHEYENKRIRRGTATKEMIRSLKPYYDYLAQHLFTAKGGKEAAARLINLTLHIFRDDWPDDKVVYDILRKS